MPIQIDLNVAARLRRIDQIVKKYADKFMKRRDGKTINFPSDV